MTAVGHYVERWLDLSAGFVAEQVRRSRHRAVVISRDGWRNLDAFPHRPRHSLNRARDVVPERAKPAVLAAGLRALCAAHRLDLIHVHFGYAAADVVSATGRHRPYVLSLHGHDATGLLHDDPDRYQRVVDAVAAVVVPSRFLAERARGAGFPADRLHVIPSGVDTDFFRPTPLPDGPPRVVFVGRLVEKKGLDVLLHAWPMIRSAAPTAVLSVLGDGPQSPLLADRPDVQWIRPIASKRREQVRDLIGSATVVVTPSRTGSDGDSESLLLVNLEAAASGRPVVSTRHGGIPEYVDDGITGLLVEQASAQALADAVVTVLRDRSLAEQLAASAVGHVAQWDVARCAARIDDLYDELLGRK